MLKKCIFCAALCTLFFFTSCLDTEEKIVLHKNNSGTYTVSIDMSKVLVMMEQFGQGANKEPDKKDSTIYFKHYADTSTALTATEKELIRDGSLHMLVDEEAKVLKVVFSLPFSNVNRLPELRSGYMAILDKMELSKKIDPDGKDPSQQAMKSDIASNQSFLSPSSSDAYIFAAAPGKISNRLSPEKTGTPEGDSTMQMLQQMSAFMGAPSYTITLVLPKKIKKYNGTNPVLSKNKKTISFSSTLNDLLSAPSAAEFNVEY